MNDNIVKFPRLNKEPIAVSDILEQAMEEDLDSVLLIGKDKNGDYFLSSSECDVRQMLWTIEILKKELLEYEP